MLVPNATDAVDGFVTAVAGGDDILVLIYGPPIAVCVRLKK